MSKFHINESEYYNDIVDYKPLLQHYTNNLLQMMQVDQIMNHITSAYDNYSIENNKEIKDFKCDRCGYTTNSKLRYNNHLTRKKPCKEIKKEKEMEMELEKETEKEIYKTSNLPTRVILIDSAKYPEDNKYNICRYCNNEYPDTATLDNHECDIKKTLSEYQLLEYDNLKLTHLMQKLCTDISFLRRNNGILLKDNILAHKMIDQYDKILNKHNINFDKI
jgi:hypothetical protein